MKTLLYAFLLITIASACTQSLPANNRIFEMEMHELPVNGSVYRICSYNNMIIGNFFEDSFFVLDTNWQRVDAVENKLNQYCGGRNEAWVFNNNLLLIGKNNEVIVLDTDFNRVAAAEAKLGPYKPYTFFYSRDTLCFPSNNAYYLITGDYNLSRIDTAEFYKRPPLEAMYSDSAYNIYACGMGEFGGSVFFENKKTGKVYSLPTYFGAIFFYDNSYRLLDLYDHISKYIKIADPSMLYPATFGSANGFCCNCDSGYHQYFYQYNELGRKQWDDAHGVSTYFDTVGLQTLYTFFYDSNLYSLCMGDSAYIILQHTDTVKQVQAIARSNKYEVGYSSIMNADVNGSHVVFLNGGYTVQIDSAAFGRTYSINGMLVLKGNRVDIYEAYRERLVKAERIK